MTNPRIVESPRARIIEKDHRRLEIRIHRVETADGWSLEIVAGNGSLTVWDEIFASDKVALDEALEIIEEDGVASFYSVVHYTDSGFSVPGAWGRHPHSNWKQ